MLDQAEAHQTPAATWVEHVDVLVVGAGISGLGAAYHLTQRFPAKRFVVLDALEDFGGTFSRNAMPIALQVDDVAFARERLEAQGVEFVSETFDSGVCWQAICLDPDGNPLSLHRRYAPTDDPPATP